MRLAPGNQPHHNHPQFNFKVALRGISVNGRVVYGRELEPAAICRGLHGARAKQERQGCNRKEQTQSHIINWKQDAISSGDRMASNCACGSMNTSCQSGFSTMAKMMACATGREFWTAL